jgi:anti-anti-sigma factor
MATTRTEMWKNPTFIIERIEGHAPRVVIYQITGSETPTRHIFDLTRVPQMDSSGLGVLVSHHIACRAKGIKVVVVGPSPNVKQLFKFTRVDTVLPVAATVEEALQL